MAIEFHCPYCTAVMRVPDEFASKQGRCPKCDTIVIVPDVRPPEMAAAGSSPGEVPAAGAQVPLTAESPPADSAQSMQVFPGLDTESGLASVTRTLKKRKRRRGPQRVWMVGVPAIFFLLLLAAISWYTVSRLPTLNGELSALILKESELPERLIPWSIAGQLSDDEQATLRYELELAPEVFISSQLRCAMLATDEGLAVSLRTTDETSWYVVDPGTHPALLLWLRKNRTQLETQRNIRLQQTFRQYCQDKLLVIEGQAALIDPEKYRNSLGLEACCEGFGSVVEAVVRNRFVRCGYEDASGRLYFCLPRGVTNFQLRGKEFSDGSKPFAGQFDVAVAGTLELTRDASETDAESPGAETADPPSDADGEMSESDASEAAHPNDSGDSQQIDPAEN